MLLDAVADPVESHIDGFRLVLFHGTADNAPCGTVVSDKWCWWLWKAKVDETIANRDGFTSIHEETSNFCFGCTGHDVFDDFGEDEDRSIEEVTVGIAKEMVAAGTGSCFGAD